jgi:hypothetical protein
MYVCLYLLGYFTNVRAKNSNIEMIGTALSLGSHQTSTERGKQVYKEDKHSNCPEDNNRSKHKKTGSATFQEKKK